MSSAGSTSDVLEVRQSGRVDATGQGYASSEGPGAGMSSDSGGGGGGYGGDGDDACMKKPTGEVIARGGKRYADVYGEWVHGSGGGRGNADLAALEGEVRRDSSAMRLRAVFCQCLKPCLTSA
jgi:hypothetical protein